MGEGKRYNYEEKQERYRESVRERERWREGGWTEALNGST